MNGSGIQASPFEVTTAVELNSIRNNLSAHYILKNDIDLASYANFVPIGTATSKFTGTIDGNGFKVKNMKINRNVINTALIGYIENGTIKNLGIVDSNVNSQTSNQSAIFVGQSNGTSLIEQCYTENSVVNGQYGQGGIVGWFTGGTVSNCWSNASITSLGRMGSLVGHVASTVAYISNSFAYGSINPPTALYIGALVGSSAGQVNTTNSYFNKDVYPTSSGGAGLTTAQFADSSNFPSWDTAIWGFSNYPYLKAFGEPVVSVPAKIQTETVTSHTGIILSSLSRSKRKLESVTTTTLPIASNVSKRATLIAESMIDDIVSNVEALQNANIKTQIISSHISGIGSTAQRKVKAIRSVESHMQPLSIITEVIVPVDVERPVYANVYILENQSNVNSITNKSDTHIKENATETQVV